MDPTEFDEARYQAEFPRSIPLSDFLSRLSSRIQELEQLGPAAETLRHQILSDLEGIRRCCGAADPTQSPDREPFASLLDQALQTGCAEGQGDAVLRYGVARRASLGRLAEEWKPVALARYMAQADDYDMVLGGGIDAELRNAARSQLAQRAYVQGSNATAALDWPVYRQNRQWRQGPLLGLPTGLPGLNDAIGGLRGFTFLGGAAEVDTPALALHMAISAIRDRPNAAVLFCCLDTPKEALFDRLVCHESGVEYRSTFQTPWPGQTAHPLDAASERLLEEVLPRLGTIDRSELADGGESFAEILKRKRADLVAKSQAETVLVVIDRYQLLDTPGPVGTVYEVDYQRLAMLRNLQVASRTAVHPGGDPYLLISEIRKTGKDGPAVSDLLGAAGLGYSAQAVLFLEFKGEQVADDDRVEMRLRIATGRDGARRMELGLSFEPGCYRFHEPAARAFPQRHDSTGDVKKPKRLTRSSSSRASWG